MNSDDLSGMLLAAASQTPPHVREFLTSGKFEKFLTQLEGDLVLHVDVANNVGTELLMVLLGITDPKALPDNLERRALVPKALVQRVMEEVNKGIFVPLGNITRGVLPVTQLTRPVENKHEAQWVNVASQPKAPPPPPLNIPAYATPQPFVPPSTPIQAPPVSINMLQSGTPASSPIRATIAETRSQPFATPVAKPSQPPVQIPGAGAQEYLRPPTPIHDPSPPSVATRTYVGDAALASGGATPVAPQERKIPIAYQTVVPGTAPSQPIQPQAYTRPYMPSASPPPHIPGSDPYREPIE